jgi:hypothetical protein
MMLSFSGGSGERASGMGPCRELALVGQAIRLLTFRLLKTDKRSLKKVRLPRPALQ